MFREASAWHLNTKSYFDLFVGLVWMIHDLTGMLIP